MWEEYLALVKLTGISWQDFSEGQSLQEDGYLRKSHMRQRTLFSALFCLLGEALTVL